MVLMQALTLRDMWLAVVLDFLSINTLWVLNEVARDLEDPFVYEPNDLPLARLQVGVLAAFTPCGLTLPFPGREGRGEMKGGGRG
jgi:predicted membrane chloride channel (bestrophin family)